ncbi:flagellar basal body P-ring protein FlgI [Frigoriglobus tundricola]|uniref:Uncharacterized protein n=1 Tax=Frigoriglobus tundricola TaxID=2774151 RepID=A0A6M5YHP6_9BACT|nr:flagellar basal body P-ring protein FlgI [Frigoriglobus tundricola]QJW93054.1 hypothetical protein FTUN_0554 [Frigoriglobus tundricola]
MPIATIVLAVLTLVPRQAERALYGYGIVIGPPGSGGHEPLTRQLTGDLLELRCGLPTYLAQPFAGLLERAGAVSAVLVASSVTAGAQVGEQLNAIVCPLDSASDLRGRFLLGTGLRAPDGVVYAIAWGRAFGGGPFKATRLRAVVTAPVPAR